MYFDSSAMMIYSIVEHTNYRIYRERLSTAADQLFNEVNRYF